VRAMENQIRVALVTGANSGIGFETAQKLLERGHHVLGLDIRSDHMESLREMFPEFKCYEVDLATPAEVEKFCDYLLSLEINPVTILINNAGYSLRGMVEEVPISVIRRIFEVNLFAAIRLTQACLPGMRTLRKGAIVNVTSIAGKFTFPGNGPYASTKHAMEAFTDALRHELGPFGIRVVAIRPAFIATQFNPTAQKLTADIASGTTSDYEMISKSALLGLTRLWQNVKPLKPESVANLIVESIFSESFHAAYSIGPMAEDFLNERARLDDDEWKDALEEKLGLKGVVV
jgi:NAD(P)-dependent dehydrogenase (short-subunit alcohol dehydrogenase family)